MRVFEYVVWVDEKKDKQTDEVVEQAAIICNPTTIVAKDESTVAMIAARGVPAEYENKLDRVQISIRPF